MVKVNAYTAVSSASPLEPTTIEQREDMALSMYAEMCERENDGRKTVSHEEAWR